MERLAAQIYEEIEALAEVYQGHLQAGRQDAGGPGGRAVAHSQLALVARCLETSDGALLVAAVREQVAGGAPPAAVLQRLSALELTLIPQVDDAQAAILVWSALAQARQVLFQPVPARPEAGSDVEQVMAEGEELFRSLVDNSQAGIFVVDDDFRFIYANDRLLEIVGSEREGVIGERFQAFLDEESRKLVADRYVRRQRGEDVPPRYEFNVVRKDGEKRRVEISSAVVTDRAGRVRTLAQVTDVTEARRLEKEVEESLARRWRQVQTSTEVAQEIASAPALDELYRRVVMLVKERFGYYHTQLFLLNRSGDRLISVAGYGEIGQQLVERGYSVPLGTGLVGRAGATGQVVLSSDVHEDALWLYDPLLPETRGELAVPIVLRSRGGSSHDVQVVGVLDVQSDRAGALTEEDELVLEGLCGQIAIAIESTRLRGQTEESLKALEGLYRSASREGWETFQEQVHAAGYRYDSGGVLPVDGSPFQGEDLMEPQPDRHLAGIAPLSIWGETFGSLGVDVDPQNPLSPDDLALLDAVSEQVAQALEGARLFDEEQRARLLLDMRVNELDCLNDVGRKIDQAPPVDELLEWVCGRLPAAMQFPDSALVAIELEGRLYGEAEASRSPWQMVQNLQVAGGKGKICIAYKETRQFLDEESALLGDVARRIAGYVENRRLLDETQRRAEEQALLNEIGRRLTACQDIDSLVAQTQPGVTQLLGVDSFYLALYDAAQEMIELPLVVLDGQVVESPPPLPLGTGGVIDYLIETGKPLLLRDRVAERLEELGIKLRSRALPSLVHEGREPASALGVPILIGERMLGAIVVMDYAEAAPGVLGSAGATVAGATVAGATVAGATVAAFDEHDRDLLIAFSNQAALALQSVRLLEETRAALAEVETAHRTYLRRGWEEHLQQSRMLERGALLYDRGVLRASGVTRRHGVDAGVDACVEEEEWSTITVPIMLRGQELGVIGVEVPVSPPSPSTQGPQETGEPDGDLGAGRAWSDDDYALLQAVSEQLGQTLESARLFADTQRLAERERLIGEITARIRASTDMRDILETTAVELGRMLGTSRALVRLTASGAAEESVRQLKGG